MKKKPQIVYCISSRIEKKGQLYGCFKIGPFLGHQSGTFANALRRTLLADTSRCTLKAIQIEGVEHEYSSLIGVRESVVDILLNLEKLTFQTAQPITKPQVGFVNFSGPGILRAQHLHLPKGLKCVDPSQYLATLEIDGRLTLKFFFSPNWNQFASLLKKPEGPLAIGPCAPNMQNMQVGGSQLTKVQKRSPLHGGQAFHQSRLKSCLNSNTFYSLTTGFENKAYKKSKQFANWARKQAQPRQTALGQLQKTKLKFYLKDNLKHLDNSKKKYLFLKNSLCSVEKAHYTLQSQTYKSNFDYILLEVWTNGTRHPKTAVFKAMNDILLDLFPFSLGQEKLKVAELPLLRQFSKSRNELREKFLNLEISNFYFDLETSIFFKKKNIHRVLDLIRFLKNPEGPSIPKESQDSIQKFKNFIINQTGLKNF